MLEPPITQCVQDTCALITACILSLMLWINHWSVSCGTNTHSWCKAASNSTSLNRWIPLKNVPHTYIQQGWDLDCNLVMVESLWPWAFTSMYTGRLLKGMVVKMQHYDGIKDVTVILLPNQQPLHGHQIQCASIRNTSHIVTEPPAPCVNWRRGHVLHVLADFNLHGQMLC